VEKFSELNGESGGRTADFYLLGPITGPSKNVMYGKIGDEKNRSNNGQVSIQQQSRARAVNASAFFGDLRRWCERVIVQRQENQER